MVSYASQQRPAPMPLPTYNVPCSDRNTRLGERCDGAQILLRIEHCQIEFLVLGYCAIHQHLEIVFEVHPPHLGMLQGLFDVIGSVLCSALVGGDANNGMRLVDLKLGLADHPNLVENVVVCRVLVTLPPDTKDTHLRR